MTYAPPLPSLSGSNVTVNWLVNNPRVIYRTLRTLVQQRLIGGQLLSGRIDLTGSGSLIFGVSEGIFPRKAAERVAPGGDYPLTDDDDGIPAFAATDKWGLSFEIPQELIARNRMDIVAKRMRKLANQIVFGFDALCLSAIATAVTQTQAAAATWATTATADPFLDIMLAGAVPDTLNQGYDVNVIALSPTYFARAIAATKIIERMPREGDSTLVVTGRMISIAGLTFLKTTNMPAGVNVIVADSTMLGSVATEALGGELWQGDPSDVNDIESKVEPLIGRDGKRVFGRKVAVPLIQEPGAAVKITGA
jgi:hypothetical protein